MVKFEVSIDIDCPYDIVVQALMKACDLLDNGLRRI
jgi:hypothetical protein